MRRSFCSCTRCSSIRRKRYDAARFAASSRPDVPALAERGEGLEGVLAAQRLVAAAVHELEELDGELDVAQPAAAELELAVGVVVADVVLDAAAHGAHVGDEVVALGGAPHHGGEGLAVLRPEREVARDRPGLEQRLELPGPGPALVVGDVALEGAHELRRSRPSGRRLASTSRNASVATRIIVEAIRVATSVGPSATKITSMSET